MSRVRIPSPAPASRRRGSQVVRQRSAKPLFSGSNPLRASIPNTGLTPSFQRLRASVDLHGTSRNIPHLRNRTTVKTRSKNLVGGRGRFSWPSGSQWAGAAAEQPGECRGDRCRAELVGFGGVNVLGDGAKFVVAQDGGERGERNTGLRSPGGEGVSEIVEDKGDAGTLQGSGCGGNSGC
jgi:hypothetical protein